MRLEWIGPALLALMSAFHSAWAADCTSEQPRDKKRYTASELNLRSLPSRYGKVLVTLPKGQIVYAYLEDGEWSRVNVARLNITGYVASRYLHSDCVPGPEITRKDLTSAQIALILMTQSQSRYSGSCPCPYYTDRAGRRCGGRSAYSRPGGASPLCYTSDVSMAMVEQFRNER